MGTLNSKGSQQHKDGQREYQHTNERNRDHARSHPVKHQYEDHDAQTDDQKFKEGKPTENMDFRDKTDNLEDQNNH